MTTREQLPRLCSRASSADVSMSRNCRSLHIDLSCGHFLSPNCCVKESDAASGFSNLAMLSSMVSTAVSSPIAELIMR